MALTYPTIILKKGKEKSVQNFHPWLFSGAILKQDDNIDDGAIVNVFANDQTFLCCGMYHKSSIAVRVLTTRQETIGQSFWDDKIQKAFELRNRLGFIENPHITAYRLIHGEGDGISGLIIDIYNSTAVLQSHVAGIFKQRELISNALLSVFQHTLTCIYDKSDDHFFTNHESRFLSGNQKEDVVLENGLKFYINWEEGQKTGFFNDQRENRKLLQSFCNGKKIINLFAYTGGFSVYALKAGALFVHSVDSSAKAQQWALQNIELNDLKDHTFFCEDVFDFIKKSTDEYQVWIVDPPAFAKRLDAVARATIGYRNLNYAVFKKAAPGSIVMTFSCSQAVDKQLFQKIIFQAAQQAGRNVKIIGLLSQPADHPVSIYHPEGEYLKGLVLYIE